MDPPRAVRAFALDLPLFCHTLHSVFSFLGNFDILAFLHRTSRDEPFNDKDMLVRFGTTREAERNGTYLHVMQPVRTFRPIARLDILVYNRIIGIHIERGSDTGIYDRSIAGFKRLPILALSIAAKYVFCCIQIEDIVVVSRLHRQGLR